MLNKFKQKIESLIPESYRHDVERLRVAKIFIWICVCALPLVLMQGVVSVLTVGDQLIAVACFSMFCLYAFVLFMFVKNVPYVIVIDTLIAFSLAVFTYITYRNGGMYAPPFPLIVVFPGFAIVMTGRLNSVIWLLAVIAVAVMLYGETIKGNPEVIQVPLAFVPNYLSIVFVVIVIVFVIFLVSDNARKTAQMETVMALEKVQRSQLMVMRQERLASFGQLAAGMAHEIQNPLNFINNFSDMSVEQLDELQEKVAGNAEAETMIEEVKENVQRVHNYGIRASEILRYVGANTRERQRAKTHQHQTVEPRVYATRLLWFPHKVSAFRMLHAGKHVFGYSYSETARKRFGAGADECFSKCILRGCRKRRGQKRSFFENLQKRNTRHH